MVDEGLTALVLGSAAGGGFPQWNCACRLCELSRAGDPRAIARTQASVAFSADGAHWLVVGASPDMRQQILQTPALQPRGTRDSPIAAVVLVSADVDGIAGLLNLRERQAFRLYAPQSILDILSQNRVFDVMSGVVTRVAVEPGQPVAVGHGMTLTLLSMPGKTPLYHEAAGATQPEAADTFAALVEAGGRRAILAPACAEVTPAVRARLAEAELVFFDGTLFRDDEMIAADVGAKTARRMGHVPIDGPGGSMAALADLPGRRVYLHINNTNPILLDGSEEHRAVIAAGFSVARDGMEIRL